MYMFTFARQSEHRGVGLLVSPGMFGGRAEAVGSPVTDRVDGAIFVMRSTC